MPGNALPLDLDAYLNRIGYTGDRQPPLDVLNTLHLAHATHIPFELHFPPGTTFDHRPKVTTTYEGDRV